VTFGPIICLRRIVRRIRRLPLLLYLAHPRALFGGVHAGPFAGTAISAITSWNNPVHFFAGTYERELHHLWVDLHPPPSVPIWVIGAAEGYYVCGLARCWNANVRAYEACEHSRKILERNVRLNSLQASTLILGKCDANEFAVQLRRDAPYLILCDIEGDEDRLFPEHLFSLLARTILVIETHPPYRLLAGIETLSKTHIVQVIKPVARDVSDYPLRDWVPKKIRLQWLQENRPFATPWVVAIPKAMNILEAPPLRGGDVRLSTR
jgi:hypothetical protein